MDVAVRYCSTYGRTKAIAEYMAEELGVAAVSIADEPVLPERVDVLFLGGAPYWSVMDPALEAYANSLDPELVGTVVLFTTSNWSHRTAIGLRTLLEAKGIYVAPGHFYAHMSQIDQSGKAARAFARDELVKAGTRGETHLAGEGIVPELITELLIVGTFVVGVVGVVALAKRAVRTYVQGIRL